MRKYGYNISIYVRDESSSRPYGFFVSARYRHPPGDTVVNISALRSNTQQVVIFITNAL